MNKIYSRYIKKEFKRKFSNEFLEWELIKTKWFPGSISYFQKNSKSWKCIELIFSPKDNSFEIILIWSQKEELEFFRSSLLEYNLWRPVSFQDFDKIVPNKIMIGLASFWEKEFDSAWAIDPTQKIIYSIKEHGYVTSDIYAKFSLVDTFKSDKITILENEYSIYIDPLIDNSIDMITKYAIPFFDYLDSKLKI